MEREKWTLEKLPAGYPRCKRGVLYDAIKDLSDELVNRSTKDSKDLFNPIWRDRITAFIQLGQNELQRKNNATTLIISGIGLVVALIAISFSVVSIWTSSRWESRQIQIIDEQQKIQKQILEEIRAYPK